MLRIVKLKSPMSVGVYALMGFSTNAGFAALEQAREDGIMPVEPGRAGSRGRSARSPPCRRPR